MAEKQPGAERTRTVTPDKHIYVSNMIGFQNHGGRGRMRIEALPHCMFGCRRSQRIDNQNLALRFDAGRPDDPVPALTGFPAGVFEPPYPQTPRNVAYFKGGWRLFVHRAPFPRPERPANEHLLSYRHRFVETPLAPLRLELEPSPDPPCVNSRGAKA